MIRTPICDLLDVEHPIALGGMGSATSPALVAAVSRAGGLGALGCHYLTPDQIRERTAAIRQDTNKPFGLNFLTFDTREDSFAAALELRPSVMQFAWARPDQDLKPYFDRAHDAGCKVTYMAGAVPEALRAAEGRRRHHHCARHRGRRSCWLDGQHAAHPNGRRCGRADSGPRRWGLCRRPRPDRRVGARRGGILLGTRFLATVESPLHANFKQAIVDSDGHDTQLSEIPDIAAGLVWPGAMTRSRRNRFVERWAGREWALRQGRVEANARLRAARESGDVDEGPLSMGQDAGLVHDIPRAADIVARIAQEAEEILTRKFPRLLAPTR